MSRVTNLPTERHRSRRATPAVPRPPSSKAMPPIVAQENLARAFVTFTQAAGSLEKSPSFVVDVFLWFAATAHAEAGRAACELVSCV